MDWEMIRKAAKLQPMNAEEMKRQVEALNRLRSQWAEVREFPLTAYDKRFLRSLRIART